MKRKVNKGPEAKSTPAELVKPQRNQSIGDGAQAQLPKLAFTMAQTAEMLGISYCSVWRLLQRGLLKSSSALRHKMIPKTEIDRFLKATIE